MIDFLFRDGESGGSRLREERLFVTSGEKEEVDRIRDDLDLGREFGAYSVHSMAECLIYFLNSLAEPIFPAAVVEQYTEGANLTHFCKQALLLLTPAHYNAFIYLVAFLRECLKYAEYNKLTPVQLVLVFAGCLMHCTVDGNSGGDTPPPPATPAPNAAAAAGQKTLPASSSSASAAGSNGNVVEAKPKAWTILMHYLTSEEFV